MTTLIDYIAGSPRLSSTQLVLVHAAGAVLGIAVAVAALVLAI